MDEYRAYKLAKEFANHQLKDYILWRRRRGFQEVIDRLCGAFVEGYKAGFEDGKVNPTKKRCAPKFTSAKYRGGK